MRSFLFFFEKDFTTIYIEREVNNMNKKNEETKDMTWWQFLLGLWILDLFF
nr:MAG TPA: hypothetical protein [Caudoviricetes sp.]